MICRPFTMTKIRYAAVKDVEPDWRWLEEVP
jgi:hypothetical protein